MDAYRDGKRFVVRADEELTALCGTGTGDSLPEFLRLRGSLTLSGSCEDGLIDANSLVRNNGEWLPGRVDAFCGASFCWALLHGQDVSAGRQGGAIVSRLVYSQPRDFSFPVLTQDDEWILGIGFGRRL